MSDSYYGKPIVKAPVWGDAIPAYFFFGGLAGGSSVLLLAARLRGNDALARRALIGALIGTVASPPLLIVDLHDPKRFHHMLRVFKVTSPMSVGTYILTAFGASITVAAVAEFFGVLRPVGRAFEVFAALLGTGLATYTATLIANTAIPVWHDAREELPFVFAGGAIASAGGFAVLTTPAASASIARRTMVAGVLLETVAMQLMERRLGTFIFEPYARGKGATFRHVAEACSIGGALLGGLFGARSRAAAVAGSALVLLGAASERFSVFYAGIDSANDPKYVVEPQRARLDARAAAAAAAAAASSPPAHATS